MRAAASARDSSLLFASSARISSSSSPARTRTSSAASTFLVSPAAQSRVTLTWFSTTSSWRTELACQRQAAASATDAPISVATTSRRGSSS
jgi:hypothetical protein